MRSSFIFCLLAMFYIASANTRFCSEIPGSPCRNFCYGYNGEGEITTRPPGTLCTMSGVKDGTCDGGECKKN
uniref:Putative salivary kunitz domain protein n=1 Tax=Ixodes ricinus TaxID=34613 RepID=A0A0K8RF57_IXORI